MKVIRRNRIGNNTEDITYTPGPDRLSETIAILDGLSVLGVTLPRLPTPAPTPTPGGGTGVPFKVGGLGQPAEVVEAQEQPGVVTPRPFPITPAAGQAVKLFDLHGLSIQSGPRGIAYIESEGLYAFNDPTQPSTLLLADGDGRPHGTRAINYLGGFTPQHVEGIAYIPQTSPVFPDHLVMVALTLRPTQESRLEVIRRDGQVVQEIRPQEPVGSSFVTGVCFKAPGQLLVSTDEDDAIYVLDFNGKIIGSTSGPRPTQPPPGLPLHGIEGLVQLPPVGPHDFGGFVAAADYDDGTLVLIPPDLELPPRPVCSYRVGVGLSQPTGIAWDTTTNQHVVLSFLRGRPSSSIFLSTVAPTLSSGRPLAELGTGKLRLGYLPDERLIAVTFRPLPDRSGKPAILLYNDQGALVEEIDVPVDKVGLPFAVTYMPTTREFVLRGQPPSVLYFLSRKGANVNGRVDLGKTSAAVKSVLGLAFFNPQHPTGGQFLVLDVQNRLVVTDLNGEKLGEFDARKELNVVRPVAVSAITTGPDAGAFAITDPDNSEIVVFRMD
jgi:hypothetical protein